MLTWTTLRDAPDLPPARYIAYALADLALPQLEQARLDLGAWDALGRAGVPAKFRRELIFEAELDPVEPMLVTRAWHEAGSLGPLVLVGDVGTAKSHALAWWALARHRAGELTHWESVSRWSALAPADLRARHAALLEKPGLVLDDIGAGGVSTWHAQIIEGLIVARHEVGRPTAAAMNATKRQVLEILGRRAVDRILAEGGVIKPLTSTTSLRRLPSPGVAAPGRGPGWRWARWALDAVGHAMVSRADGDGYVLEPSYGDKLAGRLARADWLDEAEKVRAHLEVPVAQLVTEARRQHDAIETDPVMRAAVEAMGEMRAAAAAEELRRSEAMRRTTADQSKGRGNRAPPHPSTVVRGAALGKLAQLNDPGGARARAKRLGFWVRESIDGYEVRHGRGGPRKRGQLMAVKLPSESAAWTLADHGFDTDTHPGM